LISPDHRRCADRWHDPPGVDAVTFTASIGCGFVGSGSPPTSPAVRRR
jgi:hypothetical protein